MAKEFAKMVKEIALSAREFVKDAREQEKRRANGAKPEVESVQPEEPRGGADADADLSANMYAKHTIIPAIDSLIDNHKDGQGIGREEVEKTFKRIMEKMVSDNLMTKGEMDDYLKPQKIKTTRKVVSDGPSRFQQDMEESLQFNDRGKVDAPNLTSLKDKLLNSIGKVCTSLGLDGIANSCRKGISLRNQKKLNKVESGMVKMTQAVVKEARTIGVGSKPKGERVGEQTQNIVAKRQRQKSDSVSR